jgi:hypothetical protein
MAKWMRFQLSGGKTPSGQQLLPQEILEETTNPQMISFDGLSLIQQPLFPVSDLHSSVNMGWFTNFDRGKGDLDTV